MDQNKHTDTLHQRNKRLAMVVFTIVFLMLGIAFAAVPLYDLFCRVTGYGGTTQVAEAFPDQEHERTVNVRFNADISRELPWQFAPQEREITVRLGQRGLTAYTAHNATARPLTGSAVYNVIPFKAGKYFHKVQCFCFDEQLLGPGQKVDMPVMFFVDPAMADDPNMEDVGTITLSYTFFKSGTPALEQAMEDFYNSPAVETRPQPITE